uniref:Uncharacterized protein n=1 Tax=Caenorhabditis tropicalis TaxID=1561998 RepID=A0A1I7U849_9PELO
MDNEEKKDELQVKPVKKERYSKVEQQQMITFICQMIDECENLEDLFILNLGCWHSFCTATGSKRTPTSLLCHFSKYLLPQLPDQNLSEVKMNCLYEGLNLPVTGDERQKLERKYCISIELDDRKRILD